MIPHMCQWFRSPRLSSFLHEDMTTARAVQPRLAAHWSCPDQETLAEAMELICFRQGPRMTTQHDAHSAAATLLQGMESSTQEELDKKARANARIVIGC